MSSPLDGRIRALAREEATALLDAAKGVTETGTGQLAALTEEVAELRARLDALEKTGAQAGEEARPAVRRTRKAAESE